MSTLPATRSHRAARVAQLHSLSPASVSIEKFMSGLELLNIYSACVSHIVDAAREDEKASKASWPAAVKDAAAVRELMGGAVYELKTPSGDIAYGYTMYNSTSIGVAADGSVGLYPDEIKAAVGTWDGSKSAVDSIVQRWAPNVLKPFGQSGRPAMSGFRVDVAGFRSATPTLKVQFVQEGQGDGGGDMIAGTDNFEVSEEGLRQSGHELSLIHI